MKLTRNLLAVTALIGVAATQLLLSHSSPALGKGKPGGGGGGDTNFAFVFEDPTKGLFLTTLDDGNRVRLTRPQGLSDDVEPRWSPDLDPDIDGYQAMIAYVRTKSDADGLYVVNPDGSGNRLVTDAIGGGQFDGSPAWTPNGREIVFEQSQWRIMAIDVATGTLRVLWEPEEYPGIDSIAISSLGQLAFNAHGDIAVDIFVMNFSLNTDGLIELDPTTIESVTDPETFQSVPSFSPDGTYLSYSEVELNGTNDDRRIVVQDLLTGSEMVVIQGVGWGRRVTWSPDGSQVAFHDRQHSSLSQDLIRITHWDDAAKREIIRVTATKRTYEVTPDWAPDWTPN